MTERVGPIAYSRAGSGPPLLLIHGLGGTRLIWKPQIERLARERDVIAVDLPGFGDSEPLAEPPTPAALAGSIAGLCRAIGVERPHLTGNSLGGWVALEMAKAGDASSLCLFSPAGLWRRPLGPRRFDAQRWSRPIRPAVLALARSPRGRAAMLRSTLARPENVPVADALALIRSWIDAPGYDAANEQMRRLLFERPEAIEVPTTIAWGEHDGLVGPPKPQRRPPGTRFLVLDGCGHTPNWDDAELVGRLILSASAGAALETGEGTAA